eukprot:scaffold292497_cov15-Prasinocladus_malaysianus.AAC.1
MTRSKVRTPLSGQCVFRVLSIRCASQREKKSRLPVMAALIELQWLASLGSVCHLSTSTRSRSQQTKP